MAPARSTTLRILCATLAADSGSARIDGELVSPGECSAADSAWACCRTTPGCIQPSRRAKTSSISAGWPACPAPVARARAAELITQLELEDIADRRAKTFSQGQKVRAALARALGCTTPATSFSTSPPMALDVPAVRKLRTLLQRLRGQGHCIVFSSHVMQEVALLCDEVVVIARGAVVASGTPAALREGNRCRHLRRCVRCPHRGRCAVIRAALTVILQGVPREPA